MERPDTFKKLAALNLNDIKEQKGEGRNALDYISWAWAWQRLHELYPTATSTIYKNAQGWNYHTDGRTCWVEVGVTVEGLEFVEHLPVMDNRNHSIPANQVTSFDVNKALKRCLTKAIAAHGLGLYVYAGEDLPDAADNALREETNKAIAATRQESKRIMTREEFKARWESNEHGGGITFDDIADCAKAWGICGNPRTHDINKIKDMVLVAAGINEKPIDPAMMPGGSRFLNAVEGHAKGLKAGQRTFREVWAASVKADATLLAAFDEAVADYKINNNL